MVMVREMLEKAKQAVLKTGTAGLVLYVEEMQVSHAKCEFLNVKNVLACSCWWLSSRSRM